MMSLNLKWTELYSKLSVVNSTQLDPVPPKEEPTSTENK